VTERALREALERLVNAFDSDMVPAGDPEWRAAQYQALAALAAADELARSRGVAKDACPICGAPSWTGRHEEPIAVVTGVSETEDGIEVKAKPLSLEATYLMSGQAWIHPHMTHYGPHAAELDADHEADPYDILLAAGICRQCRQPCRWPEDEE
jgi:hypothetical protein